MKVPLTIILAAILLTSMAKDWGTNFEKAKEVARKEHKYILLNFSGSDWCQPCIRTTKEILKSEHLLAFADTNLVLVNADFPRLKKNKLSKEQSGENKLVAEKYNNEGMYPLTLLLNAKGKILKKWVGYPRLSPEKFVEEIKSAELDNRP